MSIVNRHIIYYIYISFDEDKITSDERMGFGQVDLRSLLQGLEDDPSFALASAVPLLFLFSLSWFYIYGVLSI